MKNDKDRIKQVFIDWFEDKPDGREFKLHHIITHARNRNHLYYRHDDTFRRYLGQLRETGVVNFECINRSKSLYKVLK